MSDPPWIEELGMIDPCPNSLEWTRQFPTAQEAWDACERGSWLLWYAARIGLTPERHRQLVVATCRIVDRHLDKVPTSELRPRNAIETTLAWTEGKAC
jgi:hypothetical protein